MLPYESEKFQEIFIAITNFFLFPITLFCVVHFIESIQSRLLASLVLFFYSFSLPFLPAGVANKFSKNFKEYLVIGIFSASVSLIVFLIKLPSELLLVVWLITIITTVDKWMKEEKDKNITLIDD